ncbi:MAG: trypsin-like peptidase domain-containing protein, partial [Oligoflexales bacterium]|nr:trypsin-like peptidase domain-containing protein [Oligoflexales bacterium]
MKLATIYCHLALIIITINLTISCKQPSVPISRSGYILGPVSNIFVVTTENKDSLSEEHLAAAVLLTNVMSTGKRKFCSGTLIQGETPDSVYRVVTNFHCFSDEETKLIDTASSGKINAQVSSICAGTKVIFGHIKGEQYKEEVGDCSTDGFRYDIDADLALFKLMKNPSPRFMPGSIWQEDEIPPNRSARVVHFPTLDLSDPKNLENMLENKTLGISLPAAQATIDNCKVLGRFPEEDWHLDPALKMGMKHTCDQIKGSSGSALWDAELNLILGINWGGITLNYPNS